MNIIGFVLLVVSIFLFGLKGMAVEMGIAVAASAVFLAFANLDKFSKFKGAGFEAELKSVVDEANATVEHLKSVATPLLITNLDLITNAGRFGGGDAINKSHELFDKLVALETEISLKDETLDEAKRKYIRINAWDMVKELSGNIERAGEDEFSIIASKKIGNHSFESAPNLVEFKQLLHNINLNEACKKQLNQIENYYSKYEL
ncbi:hypothetical protein [Psychromonas sp. SA13A]|uniref:hypothetical protein n=1 Tax=Psychromonas sp. SA13A TaxID=2686346 RepID=UPI00140B6B82|nr:hypothetical protein [Psychromonas sp. SA13A]